MSEFNLLDPFFATHLLCFDKWVDPEGFYTMTKKQRLLLLQRYKSVAVPPTKSNCWIWFGSYMTQSHTPRYNNESVPRLLYSMNITTLPSGGNLRGKFNATKSDVNPYKYFPKTGQRKAELIQQFHDLTGASVGDMLNTNMDARLKSQINQCLKEIRDYYVPDILDSKALIKQGLLPQYPEIVIDAAFEQFEEPLTP